MLAARKQIFYLCSCSQKNRSARMRAKTIRHPSFKWPNCLIPYDVVICCILEMTTRKIESFYKNSRRLWNLICNFLLSRILWLQVVKCSNVRHFPSPSNICKCCGCVFFRGYRHIICHPLLKKGVPCVRHIIWGRGEFTTHSTHFGPAEGKIHLLSVT